jgi:hypothetical protein
MSERPTRQTRLVASELAERGTALAIQALPFSIVLAVVAFMVEKEGAFALTVWSPLALLLLGVVVTVALSAGQLLATGSRWSIAATASLAAFTVWSFVTILWAGVRGDAWDGANRTVLYLLVFALVATWPTSVRAVWPMLLAAGTLIAIEGIVTVEQAIHAADPTQFTIGSRLSEPLGYPSANAALFMTMAWLMVGLASRAWIPAPARGLAFGLSGIYAVLNLLCESRGSVFTLPLVAGAYFVFVPGRLRSVSVIGLVTLGTLPVIRPVIDVYSGDATKIGASLRHALDLSLVWATVLAVLGWLFAALDDRLRIAPRVTRAAGLAVVSVAVLVAVGGLAFAKPWPHANSAWHSFKYAGEPQGTASHFGGLGSNRYDFWRVALLEFKRHPIQGIGPNNFLVPYLEQRRSSEEPIYPHSLLLGLLSQTGLIGTALFMGFLTSVLVVVRRIPKGRERELAGVLIAAASVWLFHGLVDWLWEMPVLSVIGMALLGAACGLAPRKLPSTDGIRNHRRRLVIATLGIGVTAVATVTIALPWFAQRDIQRAVALWPTDASASFSILQRAHGLDPLSNKPDVLAGAIADRLHRYTLMRTRYRSAVQRSPHDWYANLELGIAASLTGDRALAATSLRKAVALNPRERIAGQVLEAFTAGRRINSDAVDRAFASQTP